MQQMISADKDEERWEELSDVASRRRIQNKLAQRRYRQNHGSQAQKRNDKNVTTLSPRGSSADSDVHQIQQPVRFQNTTLQAKHHQPPSAFVLTKALPCSCQSGPQISRACDCEYANKDGSADDAQLAKASASNADLLCVSNRSSFHTGHEKDALHVTHNDELAESSFMLDAAAFVDIPDFETLVFSETEDGATVVQPNIASEARSEPSLKQGESQELLSGTQRSVRTTAIGGLGTGTHFTQPMNLPPALVQEGIQALPSGTTPLHCAVLGGYGGIVRMLVDRGSLLDCVDVFGRTPLHIAVEKNDGALIKLLLDLKADWTRKDLAGRTSLHLAAQSGHLESMSSLMEVVTAVDGVDFFGRTALHIAVVTGNAEMVALMIQKGADVNVAALPDLVNEI